MKLISGTDHVVSNPKTNQTVMKKKSRASVRRTCCVEPSGETLLRQEIN